MKNGKKIKKPGKGFWKDRRGQSTTEYILILFVVVMLASKFKQKITDRMDQATDQVGSEIEKVLSP